MNSQRQNLFEIDNRFSILNYEDEDIWQENKWRNKAIQRESRNILREEMKALQKIMQYLNTKYNMVKIKKSYREIRDEKGGFTAMTTAVTDRITYLPA